MKTPLLNVTKTIFDNGLSLLILEKHDAPIVASTIWYRVGAVNEKNGQTGISHFLEHLMFKGTHTYAKNEIDRLTSAHGGSNNAGTNYDYTMYYFNFASDRWEIALAIEADRMRNCLFDPDEFEAERHVILEELKQHQDSPWGELGTQLEATMFQAHPYHHTPLGWQEEIESVSRETVIEYYHTYYVPNNATIVIVGDIDTQMTIANVHKLFGSLSPGQAFPPLCSQKPDQQQEERRFKLFQDTNLKRLQIGYHTTTLPEQDTYVLDLIDNILSHGKTARLYQRLVEQEQLVNYVNTYHQSRRLAGVFYIFATLRPGISAKHVESILSEEILRLQSEGVSPEELQKVKNVVSADFVFERETVLGLANTLGEYEMLHTYEYLTTYIDHIEQVTPADIIRVARTYLVENNRTIGWSLPQNPETEVGHSPSSGPESSRSGIFADKRGYHKPPRAQGCLSMPTGECLSSPAAHPASFASEIFLQNNQRFRQHRWMLDNGLIVLFLENHTLPVVSIEMFINAGQKYEPDEKAGMAILTGKLLDEGTTTRSGFEIAQTIESVGGSLHTSSRSISAQVLSRDLSLALELVSDILIHPVFEHEKFEERRQRLLGILKGDKDNLALVAYNLFHEMVYGSHPYHRPRRGYKETIQKLARADIVAYYTTYFVPNNTIIAIVGDTEPDTVIEHVKHYFGTWANHVLPPPPTFTIPQPHGCMTNHIYREKEQVHLYLGHLGITRTNPDFYTILIMDHILGTGQGFTDRISRKLRDNQGLAYTVFANMTFSAEEEPGTFMAYIATSPENMHLAVDGFLEEIRKIRTEHVSQDELDLVKNYLTGSYVFNFETSSQLAHYLITVERFQLGEEFLWRFPQLINNVTVDDIDRVAQQYLDPENYYVAVVGKVSPC